MVRALAGMEPGRPAHESAGGSSEAKHTAQELKSTAEQVAGTVASDVREGVAEGAARVRDEAAARTEDAKQGIARQMAATAEALDAAAQDMDESSLQRGLLREASKSLAGMAEALQGRSMGELVSQVSEFGRRNPVPFLGGAALAGFALARLAVASTPAEEGPVPGDWPHDRPTTAPAHAMETPTTQSYQEGVLE